MIDIFRDNYLSPTQLKTKEIKKLDEVLSKNKVTCSCGHVIIFTNKDDRLFCDWCGKYCYKDKETEFRYRMLSKLSK